MLSLGIDIGGTAVKAGVVDDEYRIVKKMSMKTPFGDSEKLFGGIAKMAAKLADGEPIGTIGVTVPGSVSSDGGILDAWNIGLRNIPVKRIIEASVKADRVVVKNDADAAGDAELAIGSLKGVNTGLLITLGTGVGGCLILNGAVFHGGLNRGTELGHAMIDRGGIKCGCGHHGCIETLCSATALKRLAEIAVDEGRGMIAQKAAAGEKADAKLLIDCAKAGDKFASRLFEEYVDSLADAIASFVNVFDPEVIALGGGVSESGDFLLDPLRRKVPGKCFFGSCGSIVKAAAGNDAGVIGSVI